MKHNCKSRHSGLWGVMAGLALLIGNPIWAQNTLPPPATRQAANIRVVAIIESSEKPGDAAAQQVADSLAERLGRQPGIVLVDRQSFQRVLKEKKLNASSGDQAALGRLVGAKFLISGRIYEAGAQQFVTASIINVATGLTTEATVSGPKGGDIDALTARLSAQVAGRLVEAATGEKGAKLPQSQVELKAKLAGQRMPTIAVAVAEQHHWAQDDRTVDRPDKTAEAEIIRILRDCGLTVKDLPADLSKKFTSDAQIDWSSGLAGIDWIIVGKSHSRFSQRMGELVDCIGQVDVTLYCRPGAGRSAMVARSCYGSDLNESLAATQALGEAGRAAGLALLQHIAALPAAEQQAARPPTQGRPEVRRTVFAVRFDNQTGQEQYDPAAAGVADLVAGMLAQQPAIRTVERQRLLSLTAEQALTLSGLTGPQYDSQCGRLLQADTLLSGRLFLVAGKLTLSAKTVDLASERVLASEQISGRPEDLWELSLRLARGLGKQMSLPLPPIELAAIDRSPMASLHFGKGLCHFYAGDMDSALMQLMRTLELDPDYIDAHYYAGKCYIALGEPAHAVIEWEKLLKRSGDHPKAAEIRKALPTLREEAEESGTQPLVLCHT